MLLLPYSFLHCLLTFLILSGHDNWQSEPLLLPCNFPLLRSSWSFIQRKMAHWWGPLSLSWSDWASSQSSFFLETSYSFFFLIFKNLSNPASCPRYLCLYLSLDFYPGLFWNCKEVRFLWHWFEFGVTLFFALAFLSSSLGLISQFGEVKLQSLSVYVYICLCMYTSYLLFNGLNLEFWEVCLMKFVLVWDWGLLGMSERRVEAFLFFIFIFIESVDNWLLEKRWVLRTLYFVRENSEKERFSCIWFDEKLRVRCCVECCWYWGRNPGLAWTVETWCFCFWRLNVYLWELVFLGFFFMSPTGSGLIVWTEWGGV